MCNFVRVVRIVSCGVLRKRFDFFNELLDVGVETIYFNRIEEIIFHMNYILERF